jgi:biopolymer transport protein ExbD
MKILGRLAFSVMFLCGSLAISVAELKLDPGGEKNAVAQGIAGLWEMDIELADRLKSEAGIDESLTGIKANVRSMILKKDSSVLKQIPEPIVKEFDEGKLPVYQAGRALFAGVRHEFVFLLTAQNGTLIVRFFRKDTSDVSSGGWLGVSLVRGGEKDGDLLFVSGSKSNAVAIPFRRSSKWANLKEFVMEIEISVPAVAPGSPTTGEIIVNVDKDGAISVEGKEMSKEAFGNLLGEISEENKNQAIILRGAQETAFDDIVAVLNICQKAGIWNIAFATTMKAVEEKEEALEIAVPKALGEKPVMISILKDGSLKLDGEKLGLKKLEASLAAKKQASPDFAIVLRADDAAKTQRFVDVINVLAELEIESITMSDSGK